MQLMTGEEARRFDSQFSSKPKQTFQQPKQDGGIVGFLQNAGKSIGSDFTRLGQGTANVINEFTGGAQKERDLNTRRNQEDIKLIKNYGEKIRSAKNPQEKQRYQNALSGLMKTSGQQDTDFQKRQADIIEQNDPLKGAAATVGIGLDVLGGGAGGSILRGGLLKAIGRATGQGALFGGAQGALEPIKEKGGQASLEDILGNATSGAGVGALTGGALGAAGGVGSKVLSRLAKNKIQFETPSVVSGKPSMLNRAGKRLTEGGSGLKAEPTVGGAKKLDQQSEFMSKYTGTPRQQRVAMEKDMGDLSNQVDEILSKNPTPIKGSEVRTKVQQAIEDPLKYADVDLNLPGVQKNLDSHLTKFGSAKSAKELNDYIKLLNPIAKKAQDKIARGAAVTDKEAAALTAKRAGDEVLSSIPEIKPLKQNMAQIFDVTPQVAKAGEKGLGVPMVSGVSTKAPVQAFKGAQSKIGAILQKGSKGKVDQKALANAFKPAEDVTGQLTTPDVSKLGAAQGAFGGLVNPTVSRNAATAQPDTQQPVEPLQEEPSMTPPATDQSGASIFNKDNVQSLILQDLASNGGKNVSTLLALYKAFGEDQAQKPLSSTAATAIGNANSGLNSLQQLEDIISQQGGVSKGTLVPGRDLFGGLGANALGTASYDTAAKNIQDVITRLRSGAAITPDEAAFYNSQLPSAFDSPDVISQKTQMFKDLFNSVADRTGGNTVDVQSLTAQ